MTLKFSFDYKTVVFALIFSFFLFSCAGSSSDEGDSAVTYITISSDGGNEKLLGQSFAFTVKDNLDKNITSQSKIYVNEQLISGNTFTPSSKGDYTVRAEFNNLPINPIKISAVVNEGTNFKHRILYEEFTGTWCGYCTIGLARHEQLLQQTSNVVFIGIHGPQGSPDPWASSATTEMENFKNVSEWPTMYINRNTLWSYDSNYTDMSLPLSKLNAYSKIGIKLNSVANGNNLSGNLKVFFAKEYSNLKYAVFMVEDDMIYNQKNYLSFLYGGANTIYNFHHHNVYRDKLTPINGESIPNSSSAFSEEFSKDFQYTIPSSYNKLNLKIVVMILDSDGTVLNVREEKIGNENQYEFL